MQTVADLCAVIQQHLASSSSRGAGVEITSDLRLLDSGLLDSMSVMSLVVEIEQRCAIRIPEDQIIASNFRTPGHLWELVTSLRPQAV